MSSALLGQVTGQDVNLEKDKSSKDRGQQEEGASCPNHGLPLNFWQDKEQAYACIKCLIDEGEVHFVDKSYESRVKHFVKVKQKAEKALRENQHMKHSIADWKDDIRDMLLRVRDQLYNFIDMFTHKFIRQIGKIEYERPELKDFVGEDRRQATRLRSLEVNMERLLNILEQVDQTPPNHKA